MWRLLCLKSKVMTSTQPPESWIGPVQQENAAPRPSEQTVAESQVYPHQGLVPALATVLKAGLPLASGKQRTSPLSSDSCRSGAWWSWRQQSEASTKELKEVWTKVVTGDTEVGTERQRGCGRKLRGKRQTSRQER